MNLDVSVLEVRLGWLSIKKHSKIVCAPWISKTAINYTYAYL